MGKYTSSVKFELISFSVIYKCIYARTENMTKKFFFNF